MKEMEEILRLKAQASQFREQVAMLKAQLKEAQASLLAEKDTTAKLRERVAEFESKAGARSEEADTQIAALQIQLAEAQSQLQTERQLSAQLTGGSMGMGAQPDSQSSQFCQQASTPTYLDSQQHHDSANYIPRQPLPQQSQRKGAFKLYVILAIILCVAVLSIYALN